jgi:predicted GIY-YIG superfamily endonuclease
MVKLFFVYILANCPRGVLYVGVTGDLAGRITAHKAKLARVHKDLWGRPTGPLRRIRIRH